MYISNVNSHSGDFDSAILVKILRVPSDPNSAAYAADCLEGEEETSPLDSGSRAGANRPRAGALPHPGGYSSLVLEQEGFFLMKKRLSQGTLAVILANLRKKTLLMVKVCSLYMVCM